nr:40S ribosomal protein S11-like [Ziziphus jujuba var. spinosa]
MVVELLFSTRFGFFAHCLPSRLCVFGFDDSHETPTMAEQTEKAFLKQPKVFLSSKKSVKGRKPGKEGIGSGRALAWGLRHQEKLLKILEEAFKHSSTHLTMLLCEGGRPCHHWPVQVRPLSKTMRFNVLKVIPAGSSAGGKKAFTVI